MFQAVEERSVNPKVVKLCLRYAKGLFPAFLKAVKYLKGVERLVFQKMPAVMVSCSCVVQVVVLTQRSRYLRRTLPSYIPVELVIPTWLKPSFDC